MNAPRVPDAVHAVSTQTTITINWSFTTTLNLRNQTFVIMYGTASGELNLSSPSVQSTIEKNNQLYSTQLESLQPGTRYFYQINSIYRFLSLSDLERSIKTLDASEFWCYTNYILSFIQ